VAQQQVAVIIGAGPAGLTAAHELLKRTGITPIVLEKSTYMGGISRTLRYKGNRIDIGGHRFFSKSDRVMQWWLERMPLESGADGSTSITYHNAVRPIGGAARTAGSDDAVMLLRPRKSRIYYLRTFFDYPIRLSRSTLQNLGLLRTVRIGLSYMRSVVFPVRNPKNLEQFFISRFGRELYTTFFKSYTEKVWGVSCREISAEWGQQRIKGLSIAKTLTHMVAGLFRSRRDLTQKNTETSLIEQFLYPKHGPGQMWEEVAREVIAMGGEILTEWSVTAIDVERGKIAAVTAVHARSGETRTFAGDFFFSTMPVKELVQSLHTDVPANVREVSGNLMYRDFITVGLLLDKLKVRDGEGAAAQLIRDNWIYIQEPDVQAGRLQIFNNWSPWLVADPTKVWVGVEYFCQEGDELWNKPDDVMAAFAAGELDKIGIIDRQDLRDSFVFRMPKTYPAYFGAYSRFDEVRRYLDAFPNLYLVGRNGMHKYNNQDHSMLTAMTAVDNIVAGRLDKDNIWEVNTEMEYHEARRDERPRERPVAAFGKVAPEARNPGI
jgi:protoporphyrinogen oxidase